MNVRDSQVVCGLLKNAGYQITEEPDKADVVMFNTCSVRQHAEDRVWSEIGRYKIVPPKFACVNSNKNNIFSKFTQANLSRGDTRPKKKIIGLVGCMAQNYKEQVFERAPDVDFVVGPTDIYKIPGIIKNLLKKKKGESPKSGDSPFFQRKIWETDSKERPEEIYHTGFYEDKAHAYVVISEGCSNFCSYCVVPYVRGPLRNRNYNDILREIEEAVESGINSITLIGQNVNAYQGLAYNVERIADSKKLSAKRYPLSAKTCNFIQLLEMVNEVKGLKEFSFVTSHPKDTSIELFRAIAGLEKLKKYLHLPVQSGSDRILGAMKRGYSRDFYLELINNYRKIVKEGVLSTDIIVGFPTETESDFQDTYNLLSGIKFDSAYIFKYSPRPNTEALRLVDDVPREEKERRHRLILELQKKISRNSNIKNQISK